MLSILNLFIAFVCFICAAVLYSGGSTPPAMSYIGFGVGYLGLAWTFY